MADAPDLARIGRNVEKMIGLKAPEADIDGYLQSEGVSAAQLRSGLMEKPKPTMSAGDALIHSPDMFMNGLSMGFLDEVRAGMKAPIDYAIAKVRGQDKSLGQAYDENLAARRGESKAFHESFPLAAFGLETAGGLAGAIPMAAASGGATAATTAGKVAQTMLGGGAPAKSMAGSVARSAAAGATAGGLTGFGEGEGGLANRLSGAAQGATIGGAVGGAAPAVIEGVARAAGPILNATGLRNAEKMADRQTLRNMGRDKVTPEMAEAKLAEFEAAGKPAMMIDLGGENTRGGARMAAGTPGEAKQAAVESLARRQEGQQGRIADDVGQAISPNTDYYGTVDDLLRARRTAAEPLYEKALAQSPVYSDRLAQFVKDPIAQAGLNKGIRIQRLESLAENKPFNPHDYAITGFNDAGDPIMGAVPNMRTLNVIKKGLDDILEGYRDKTSGRLMLDEEGRAIDKVRRAFLGELDNANADYKAARQAWAGPSQAKDALALGRDLFSRDAEVTADMIKNMSASERDMFRAGVARALKDAAGKTKERFNLADRIASTPGAKEKLALAFDTPDQFAAFMKRVDMENTMFQNAAHVSPKTGSQTQLRQGEAADAMIDPSLAGALLHSPTITSTVKNTLGALYRRGQGMNSATSDVLSGKMFTSDAAANRAYLQQLIERRDKDAAKVANAREFGRLAQLVIGGGIGRHNAEGQGSR